MIIALLPAALVGVGGSIVFDTRMAFAGIAVWFVAFSLLAVIMSKLSDIDHPEKDPEIAKDARQRLYDKGWEFGRVPSLVKKNSAASSFKSRIEKKYVGAKSPENMVGGRWIHPREYIFAQVNEEMNQGM
jgi:hypothetical protein